MLQENELVMVIMGFVTLLFIILNRHQLKRIPSAAILLSSFFILYIGWFLTIMEEFLLGDILNFLEHTSYAASSILMAIWCWKTFHLKNNIF